MKEVLDKNFNRVYPRLEEAVKNASFIAIDAEFTGIQSSEVLKYSLFDSLSVRYEKLRENIQPFLIIQCGLAIFHHVHDENVYIAKCFNFYLLPRSVPFKNRQFSWQVAALEFLSAHHFDFKKFVSGISYLDELDEELLRKHLEEDNILNNLEHLTFDEEDEFKDCKSKVYEWLKNPYSDCNSLEIETISPTLQYMVHKRVRQNFNNVWTISGYKSVLVIRVSPDVRTILETEEKDALETELLNTYLGFSQIFKLLVSSKKPLIGHNVLLDIMFMHQQFYKPLPSKYNEFKNNVHTLFPEIYDTKFLSFELKKVLNKGVMKIKINSLKNIYEYFKDTTGEHLALNSPVIRMENEDKYKISEKKNYHNAGWDAYFAGYIFIKMAHLFCINKYGEGLEQRSVTHTELMSSVKSYANSINVVRSNELSLKLDGNDPPSTRPEWLHVKLKSPSINMNELTDSPPLDTWT
ncbi:pre-piRNA 3'-exonuclease trimmer isoform X2 [Calliopsis andreniformis]|uniref:pre-piRNA 3'-exonuclease trimmer isoform X2 n=1 Tax=Calliopsis andreniformis TaxID=337506 RepID=UPI003FCEA159